MSFIEKERSASHAEVKGKVRARAKKVVDELLLHSPTVLHICKQHLGTGLAANGMISSGDT